MPPRNDDPRRGCDDRRRCNHAAVARTFGCANRIVVFALTAFALTPAAMRAQTFAQATNLAALTAYPDFYVDRTVVVRGHLRDVSGRVFLEDDDGHRVLTAWKVRERPGGRIEATGTLLDLGKLKQDDPRLGGYDMAAVVGTSGQEWPRPGDVFLFAVSRAAADDSDAGASLGQSPSIRSLVLAGPRAAGRTVKIVGQFRGRNLFGDLPRSPGASRWDFVVRSGDAAVWVTGMQPRGRDFDFDPDKRVDSNRWLEVTGAVREEHGLVVIQATRLALAQPDAAQAVVDAASHPKQVAPASPPEILFSIPTPGETDVSPNVTVRIQLSRPVDLASLVDRVRVGYIDPATGQATGIESSTALEERNDAPGGAVAVLAIRFAAPLERWKTVRIELLEGIKAPDGLLLKPWSLTFTVGGQGTIRNAVSTFSVRSLRFTDSSMT